MDLVLFKHSKEEKIMKLVTDFKNMNLLDYINCVSLNDIITDYCYICDKKINKQMLLWNCAEHIMCDSCFTELSAHFPNIVMYNIRPGYFNVIHIMSGMDGGPFFNCGNMF